MFKAWLQLTARSPEMLAPARIPVAAGKKMAKTEKNVSPRKSGPMFSHMTEPGRREEDLRMSEKAKLGEANSFQDAVQVWPYYRNQRSPMTSWIRRE